MSARLKKEQKMDSAELVHNASGHRPGRIAKANEREHGIEDRPDVVIDKVTAYHCVGVSTIVIVCFTRTAGG